MQEALSASEEAVMDKAEQYRARRQAVEKLGKAQKTVQVLRALLAQALLEEVSAEQELGRAERELPEAP